MKITREQPEPEYVLRLSYTELHSLYHLMLDLKRQQWALDSTDCEFLAALREHA